MHTRNPPPRHQFETDDRSDHNPITNNVAV